MIDRNLRNLRRLHRLSQEELAEKLGVSRQAVAKWESGETVPDLTNCMALARLYGVTLDNLINYEDDYGGAMLPPKGKHFFGAVKVGERGQIVIPKQAREVFHINPGDSIIVLGDEERGIAIVKAEDFLLLPTMIAESLEKRGEEEK